jgi:hypothetical protein
MMKMAEQVMIPIPRTLYEQTARLARSRNQDVATVVVEALTDLLPTAETDGPFVDLSEPDEAAEHEMQAYLAMHPALKKSHLGLHVAIHGGKLVDSDQDYDALYARIDEQYPDEFVWLTTVEEQPIRTLTFRSPRLVRDN